jgi:hypothetical protein
MVEETIDARLSKTSQLLAEVKIFAHSGIRIVVCALNGSTDAKNVGDQCCMANFLICHELDQEAVLSRETSCLKIFGGKSCQAIMEQIELNPFLVQSECERMVVEVTLGIIDWLGAIGAEAASRGVWRWLRIVEITIRWICGCCWVGRQGWN